MRLLLIGFALALIAFAVPSASGHGMKHHYHHTEFHYTQPRYAACKCDFGYSPLACSPAVSCYAEGGRCRATCPPQTGR